MATGASRDMIVTNTFFMALAILSVILRFFLRWKQENAKYAVDDWLILLAMICSAALAITNIVGVPIAGFGTPFDSLDQHGHETFLKFLFMVQFWYLVAVGLVKASVLCLYGRLFSANRWPIAVKVLLVITAAWLISFFFATLFQIWPIRCNWVECAPTTDYTAMYVASSVTNTVIDISILSLPSFFIRKLNLNIHQKLGLIAIFGLGMFCVVASIARLVFAVQYKQVYIEEDYEVNFDGPVVNMIMWSGIEACCSTICGSLPCFAPLLKNWHAVLNFFTSFRFTISPSSGSSQYTDRRLFQKNRSNEINLDEPYGPNVPFTRTTVQGRVNDFDMESGDLDLSKIKVDTDVHVHNE